MEREEAIKIVKSHYPANKQMLNEALEFLIPELKESDDERIRKALVRFHKSTIDVDGIKGEDILAWLEKQKSVGEIVERCKNSWYNEGKIAGQFEGLTDDEKYQQGWHDALETWKDMRLEVYQQASGNRHEPNYSDDTTKMFSLSDIDEIFEKISEEQQKGEQKVSYTTLVETGNGGINALVTRELPTNSCDDSNYCSDCINKKGCINCENGDMKETEHKVEPKFKVGDWIINDQGSAFQIAYIDTENCRYVFEIGGYTKEEMNYENIAFANNHYREWTIDDAKDGDVLYSLDSKQPFIFKHRKPNEQAAVYCGINTYGKFFIGNTKDCVITTDKYIPADKFQRDLLFKKIEESGYQWDAKNKELKLLISNGGDFESNNSEQKPTWSEEDEKMYRMCVDAVEYYHTSEDESAIRDWLKSLKERLS